MVGAPQVKSLLPWAEPLSVCLHAAHQAGPLFGKRVLVTGCGPIGALMVVVARYDLSTALGVHGEFESPVFLDAVATVERAARAAGIPLGGIALTPEQSAAMATSGYRLLINAVDTLVLQAGVAAFANW